jgi:cell division protein FtsN
MSSTSENETEILLGNKHLLAIFFVLAVLLGIAFTGGYMVGRNSPDKTTTPLVAAVGSGDASTNSKDGKQTIVLPPPGNDTNEHQPPPPPVEADKPAVLETTPVEKVDRPVEKPAKKELAKPITATKPPKPVPVEKEISTPKSGQTFLQVAAVGHTEAKAMASVLSKKGFSAHAVAKPGAKNVYRVLIGPTRDASDLSNTRSALRNAGFTEIVVQRY